MGLLKQALLSLLLIPILVSSERALALEARWREIEVGSTPPSIRRGAEGIYDPANNRLIFHGGESPPPPTFLPDTWFFNLSDQSWERFVGTDADPRCHHTFVTDADNNRGLLFGGFPRTNKLWAWDQNGSFWSDITPTANNPAPRCLHSAVVFESRDEMIVYGGLNGGFTPDLQDTWAYHLEENEWNLLAEESPPGRRYGHVAALDEARDRMIVFSGFWTPSGGSAFDAIDVGDLWEFKRQTNVWTELAPSSPGPSPRQFAKGATLPDGSGMILFGGRSNGTHLNDLWVLDYATLEWTEIIPEGPAPDPRFRHSMVMDQEGSRLWIAFGEGVAGTHYSDIWILEITQETPSAIPADLDGNGSINFTDLAIFLLQWRVRPGS